jgi:hypothetical protein
MGASHHEKCLHLDRMVRVKIADKKRDVEENRLTGKLYCGGKPKRQPAVARAITPFIAFAPVFCGTFSISSPRENRGVS